MAVRGGRGRPLVSQRPRSRCRAEGLPRLRATCGGSLARSAYPRKTPGERKRCWPARDVEGEATPPIIY